jgi:hypothetical protein
MLLEIVITVVVIVGILLFVGVPLTSILSILIIGLSSLLALSIALFVIFFLFTDISLLFYRRTEAEFVEIDETTRFERAVYRANGERFTCSFPAESVARRQIYEKPQHFILIPKSGKRRNAYDRHSLFIIAVGNVFAVLLTAAAVFVLIRFQIF